MFMTSQTDVNKLVALFLLNIEQVLSGADVGVAIKVSLDIGLGKLKRHISHPSCKILSGSLNVTGH